MVSLYWVWGGGKEGGHKTWPKHFQMSPIQNVENPCYRYQIYKLIVQASRSAILRNCENVARIFEYIFFQSKLFLTPIIAS